MTKNILIFGALGSIGNHLMKEFTKNNINIIGTTTDGLFDVSDKSIIYVDKTHLENLQSVPMLDGIVWAHGMNTNDNIFTFNEETYSKVIDANVTFIIVTLNYLLKQNKINNGAKMVIISSIWENNTRNNKLTYSISKSALSNLVKNLSFDLSKHNALINNVLPGPIENEMTIRTLSEKELNYIKKYSHFDRLVSLDDVYNLVHFLCVENTGVTGQSICVDLGFSAIRKYS